MTANSRPRRAQPASPVGTLLRRWRTHRGVSQLALAMTSGFSARHVSFLESGRAQPSREALEVLSEALDVPLRERNRLLVAAGFAPRYRHTPLSASEMAPVRHVLQFVLDRYLPYAAVVLDRYSNCIQGNGASGRLLARFVDPSLLTGHANHLRVVFHPLGLGRVIVNREEVYRHLWRRAERELGESEGDAVADAMLAELRSYAESASTTTETATDAPASLLLPIHIKSADVELRLFTTLMTFGSPQDVTLEELRVEAFFPADSASEEQWHRLMGTV